MKNFRIWMAPAALAGLLACGKEDGPTGPDTEKSCTELGDSVAAANPGSVSAVFKVIRPNGGEAYRLGDSLYVRVTGNLNAANALVLLRVVTSTGVRFGFLPGIQTSQNVFTNCDYAFAIPDSLVPYTGAAKVAVVSDSVKVRVERYGDATINDLSDAFFRITP